MTENDLKYWKAVLGPVVPEHLVTPEVVALRDQQNKMLSLMAKKNADYGNAFNKGCDKLGYRYGLARMYDKANRLVHLIEDDFQGYSNPNVEDESMFDTIQDLGNYCNMLLAWQASDNGHEPTIPSTGRVETVFIDISNLVKTDKLILIEETSKKDVTNEIIAAYGFENLCKDKDGYVYNLSADNKEIPVTSEHKENVIAMTSEDYEAGKDFVKRKVNNMIKVVNPSVEVWKQEGYTLDAIFKHIAKCTRVAYQSTPKNKDEDAYDFLLRTIFKGNDFFGYSKINPKNRFERILAQNAYGDVDLTSLHLSCCEHATVHLKFPTFMPRAVAMWEGVYEHNKYSRTNNHDGYLYVTTNLRVIIENYAIDTLEFIDTTPNCPYYMPRTTVCFITDIGASRELNRHRVNSIVEESTRYCRYNANKFGNNISVAKLPWIPDSDADGQCYNTGFYGDEEIFNDNYLQGHYCEGWTAIDWFLYGLQIANLVYCKCIELGWTAQQAREILPLNTKTQVVHTAFVDDWEHLIALRSNQVSGKVHPMMGELAKQLLKQVYPE